MQIAWYTPSADRFAQQREAKQDAGKASHGQQASKLTKSIKTHWTIKYDIQMCTRLAFFWLIHSYSLAIIEWDGHPINRLITHNNFSFCTMDETRVTVSRVPVTWDS
jgi:hypothetical protein